MRWLFIFCSILILSGCCGSEVVSRKIAFTRPALIDTLGAEEFRFKFKDQENDTIIEFDGYRGIKLRDGSKDTALIAEFIPTLNKFVIKIPERIDTVIIQDTIRLNPTDSIIRGNDNSERLIWIISFMLTTIFIMIYKRYSNVNKSTK